MSNKKITYIFGAGASAARLPTVRELPNYIDEVIKMLDLEHNKFPADTFFDNPKTGMSKEEIRLKLIFELKWVHEHALNHASIDTFAKKLYLTKRHDELNMLKRAFSAYFVLEQERRQTDPRYDTFYASILKNDITKFPKDIRILSWNYDHQFEKAFTAYSNNQEIEVNQAFLNVVSKYHYSAPDDLDKFTIYKLNGTTINRLNNRFGDIPYLKKTNVEFTLETIEEVLKNYSAHFSNPKIDGLFDGLSFAWERFKRNDVDIIEVAKKAVSDTNILVVIGYSFPYFNRDIDREFIKQMPFLEKVYLQSPEALSLRDRFLSILPDFNSERIKLHADCSQFLIPDELP